MIENNLSLFYNIRYPPSRSVVLHAHYCKHDSIPLIQRNTS